MFSEVLASKRKTDFFLAIFSGKQHFYQPVAIQGRTLEAVAQLKLFFHLSNKFMQK